MHNNPAKDLLIQQNGPKALSKQQIQFNKNIRQIETLQQKLVDKGRELDQLNDYYRKELYPVMVEGRSVRKRLLKALFPFYKRKRKELSQKEHETLGQIIAEQLGMVMEYEEDPDEELDAICQKINGNSIEEEQADDLMFDKMMSIDLLRMQGIEVEESDFDHVKTVAELQKAIIEKLYAHQSAADEYPGNHANSTKDIPRSTASPRKKTAAQIRRENLEKEKETLKSRNISIIYKQLAKLFHPDLEQDSDKKVEKEALMKELTAAYQQKDLHTLLRLELLWINKQENDPSQLAEDKLVIYNQILKEHIKELKIQLEALQDHPQYRELMLLVPYSTVTKASLKELVFLRLSENEQMLESLQLFLRKDASSIQEIKEVIWTKVEAEEEDEEMDWMYEAMLDDLRAAHFSKKPKTSKRK